ncbi:MAG: glycosyltransferase family A protein [Azonexus sp.]
MIPLVSIVIPSYNSSGYLQKALNSVFGAVDAISFEIIVVDDCSEDIDSLRALLANHDAVKLIEKRTKSNASDSRNIGLAAALGDFVFFLDSDDCYARGYINNRVDLHRKLSCGVFFGNFFMVNKVGMVRSEVAAYSGGDIRSYIFGGGGDVRSSTLSLFRGEYKGTLFDPLQGKHQDWGFAVRCFDAGETMLLDPAHGVFINNGSSISRMSNRMNIEASRYFVDRYLSDSAHVATFAKRHIALAIRSGDREGMAFLRGLLADLVGRFAGGGRIKVLLLLVLVVPQPSVAYARVVDAGMFVLASWRRLSRWLLENVFSHDRHAPTCSTSCTERSDGLISGRGERK